MKRVDEFYQRIGQRLKESRVAAGVSQLTAAYELRVTDRTISKYENGRSGVPLKMFVSMCDMYQVSAADVLLMDDVEWAQRGDKK